MKVGSTEIPAGDVKVTWNGTGDNVQVTLAENGKTLTIPAKLVEEKHTHKGYIVSREGGSDQLETIQLSNVSLQLEERDRFRPLTAFHPRSEPSLTLRTSFCSFTFK